ncbi:unnamed protein product [Chilo suppressalis]|uniref:BTB domain-containing protein n=1 Tax=Chilo suppressalis TaxID=168631 RepID=A0ABN8L884_CHISP|nr:unnamed protein product [Chilo suppressalis]
MSQTQLSLTWQSFRNNICDGLSSFQQREEFVDMTLAADGHFVKVHQMILSLASPYLKELITSAPCPHPVLFLNQISYRTLCSILEYIYSGEVIVSKDDISELMQAAKALHIKGLEEMDWIDESARDQISLSASATDVKLISPAGKIVKQRKHAAYPIDSRKVQIDTITDSYSKLSNQEELNQNDDFMDTTDFDDSFDHHTPETKDVEDTKTTDIAKHQTIQYTLSNQGNIQMILNRFMYNLVYSYKNSNPPVRLWKCVENKANKCKASVTTKDDMVVQRVGAHKHAFHDKKILKKIEFGIVLSAIKDAESRGKIMKESRSNDTDITDAPSKVIKTKDPLRG